MGELGGGGGICQIKPSVPPCDFSICNCFSFSDDATLIMVDLYVRSFAKIDDVKMEYRHGIPSLLL
jgi:hypothetical protein